MIGSVGVSLGSDLGFYFLVVFGAFWILLALIGLFITMGNMISPHSSSDSHHFFQHLAQRLGIHGKYRH